MVSLAASASDEACWLPSISMKRRFSKQTKWHLPTKFEQCEPSVAQKLPHRCFGVGGLATHFPGYAVVTFRHLPMVRCLRHNPTPGAFGATLFHKGRGKF
jgi:hypothetical protein